MAITDLLYAPLDGLRRYAGSVSWGPAVQFSRTALLGVLSRITVGRLKVIDTDGTETVYGFKATDLEPATELVILKDTFWVRVLLFADMGFAESYMLEEFSCPDLIAFFEIFILNRKQLSNYSTTISSLSASLSGLARSTNTLANARLNISAHYDISNEMFAAFLSPDMTYSCPIWRERADPKAAAETLEEAQERKLHYFISEAHIKASDHVLEIGTGWGSFAIAAVRKTGCRVTSVTLSTEQKALAEQRIAKAGLSENIEVLLCDYRDLSAPRDRSHYDKIVSIEMLEAVGREFLKTYFQCISKLLKPEGGIAVFQCITMPETRYEAYYASTDFIRTYIFPGGHLPTVSQLVAAIDSGSASSLIVDNVANIGPHYARTLRCWREEFAKNFDGIIKPDLMKKRGMSEDEVEVFRRKWTYYFEYCEAGFRTKTLGDVIIIAGREGATEMAEDVIL